MSINNQHKIGYKHAAHFGWIPNEWEFEEIGKRLELLSGYAFESDKYSNEGIRLLRGANVKRGETEWLENNTAYWKEISPELKRYWLSEGDLVIAMDGSLVGRSYAQISKNDLPCLLLQRVARIRSTKIDLTYLKFIIGSNYFIRYCDGVKTVTAIPHISSYDIKKFKIPLPCLSEQRKIANILSTWDKAITKIQELIVQIQQRNEGIMQQMLSGKKRLKTFEGEWKKVRLGDYLIKHEEKSSTSSQYPVLTSSREGLFLQRDYYKREVASVDNTGYNVVPKGFFTYRHMSDDLIFKFNINDIVDKGIVSTLYPVFNTNNNLDKYFLRYKLNEGREFAHFAMEQKQGGSRTYVYFSKLSELKVMLPKLDEQIAIRNAIDAAHVEQSIYEQKLATLQKQKKGLLQKLLTGVVRVKV